MAWSSSIRRRAVAVRRVHPAEVPTTLLATLLLSVAVVSLRSRGFRVANSRVSALCRRCTYADPPSSAENVIERVVRNVDIAADLIPSSVTCLPRSLVVHELLQRRGLNTALRIGVRTVSAGLTAHAWVEFQGVPVKDSRQFVAQFEAFDDPVTSTVVAAMQ